MSQEFVLLTTQKPAVGSPCNRCGMCCQNEACFLSREYLHSDVSPCVALQFGPDGYECGLVVNASRYLGTPEFADSTLGAVFAASLGIGESCDSES